MRCPQCNKQVKPGAKFCGYCGASFSSAQQEASPEINEVSPEINEARGEKPGGSKFRLSAGTIVMLLLGALAIVTLILLARHIYDRTPESVRQSFISSQELAEKSILNTLQYNQGLYNRIDERCAMNYALHKEVCIKARSVNERANEICSYLEEIKIELVAAVSPEAYDNGRIDVDRLKNAGNKRIVKQILLEQRRGVEIKKMMDEFREFILYMPFSLTSEHAVLVEDIERELDTYAQPGTKSGIVIPWEVYLFDSASVLEALNTLTSLQTAIRKAETSALLLILEHMD